MTQSDTPANDGETPTPNGAEETNDAAAETAEPGERTPDDVIAALADENAQLKDQMMRLAADLENTRKRGQREKVEAGQYAIANFARDLISVADNFERALRAAGVSGDTAPEGHSETFNSLVSGIQMTEKELLTVLQRHGVQKVEPAGEKFDPNLHQAVANVPSDAPKGHVADVAQPGFTIGERVLRAAMVTVSTGAPPVAAAEGGTDAEG